MKNKKNTAITFCLFLQFLFSANTYAQFTSIPDANFEQRLITLSIDTDGVVNGQMLTADALSVFGLDVSSSSISDLTGIEAFVDVVTLQVQGNSLTSLDVTSNTNLTWFNCYNNSLTTLNTTGLTALKSIECYNNSLASLDVTTNTALENLVFSDNDLTGINLVNNTALITLVCNSNDLLALDLTTNVALTKVHALANNLGFNDPNSFKMKNTNNTNISTIDFDIKFNWHTMCIEVDNEVWSTTNWTNKQVHHFYAVDCAAALPVKLLYFTASVQNEKVKLKWKTATEINNLGFEIESSTDGVIWAKIDFIEGQKNSDRGGNYAYIDNGPQGGMNYYRLKQIDTDEGYEYSDVTNIFVGMKKEYKITPNPARSEVHISNLNESPLEIIIIDCLGQKVLEKTINNNLDVGHLKSGLYIVTIKSIEGNITSKRLIIE